MKIKSTLIYLAVTAALFGFIYFFEREHKSTDERSRAEKKLFVDLNVDDIQRLEIKQGPETVRLEKKDQKWQITHPLMVEPESVELNQVLTELEMGEALRVIATEELGPGQEAENLKQMGLQQPTLQITFATARQTYQLWIGRKLPTRESYYGRTSQAVGAPILLLSGTTYSALNKRLNDLRSREVFSGASAEISRLGVRQSTQDGQPSRNLEAEKKEGQWWLQKPLVARADQGKITAWLTNALALRITQFISDESGDLGAYGLNNPHSQIWFQNTSVGEENTLVLGSVVPGRPTEIYAKRLRKNSIFTVSQAQVKPVLEGLAEARDKRILAFDPAHINRIRVENRGKVVAASLQDGQWLVEGSAPGTSDPATIKGFLEKLRTLEVTAFVKDTTSDLKSFGLDKPTHKITLGQTTSAEVIELRLGKQEKKQWFIQNSSEPFVASVDPKFAEILPKENYSWRNLQVIGLTRELVKVFTVVGRDGVRITVQRAADGSYTTTQPNHQVSKPLADAQISLLCQLRALSWLGPVLPTMGLARPTLQLELSVGTGVRLKVGSQLPSGNYAAQIEGQDLAFELASTDFDLLEQTPVSSVEPAKASTPVQP